MPQSFYPVSIEEYVAAMASIDKIEATPSDRQKWGIIDACASFNAEASASFQPTEEQPEFQPITPAEYADLRLFSEAEPVDGVYEKTGSVLDSWANQVDGGDGQGGNAEEWYKPLIKANPDMTLTQIKAAFPYLIRPKE